MGGGCLGCVNLWKSSCKVFDEGGGCFLVVDLLLILLVQFSRSEWCCARLEHWGPSGLVVSTLWACMAICGDLDGEICYMSICGGPVVEFLLCEA